MNFTQKFTRLNFALIACNVISANTPALVHLFACILQSKEVWKVRKFATFLFVAGTKSRELF